MNSPLVHVDDESNLRAPHTCISSPIRRDPTGNRKGMMGQTLIGRSTETKLGEFSEYNGSWYAAWALVNFTLPKADGMQHANARLGDFCEG